MGLLQDVFGGSQQQQQQYQDFANRYHQGSPYEGYTPQEAHQYYNQVAQQLPPEQYQRAAQETFSGMRPEDREQFARHMHERAMQQGYAIPGMNPGQYGQFRDPNVLAQMTTQMQQQQPGILGQIFGGGNQGGNFGGNFGGNQGSNNSGGMNTLEKVALGGIAAYAAKELIDKKL